MAEDADLSEYEAGIYVWSLDTDVLFGDTAIADLFGMDADQTVSGLPLSAYLARVVPEDKATVSRAIAQAVRDGQPYHAEYRVIDRLGDVRWVMALGRCFRDKTGNPVHHAGIVYPLERLA